MTHETLLRWIGIHEYMRLVDERDVQLFPDQCVQPWKTIVVQLTPEDVEFELQLRLNGGGPAGFSDSPGLRVTHPFVSTGLWHCDQLVHALSWAGASFSHLVYWLPSFAAAVLELWPSTMEEHLKAWLQAETFLLFAIVRESWGWNLVRFCLEEDSLEVTFYECGLPSLSGCFLPCLSGQICCQPPDLQREFLCHASPWRSRDIGTWLLVYLPRLLLLCERPEMHDVVAAVLTLSLQVKILPLWTMWAGFRVSFPLGHSWIWCIFSVGLLSNSFWISPEACFGNLQHVS